MSTDKPWGDLPTKTTPVLTDILAILDSEDSDPDTKNKIITINSLPGLTSGALNDLTDVTITSQKTGDLLFANSTTSWENLNPGVDGQILTLSGGVPNWSDSTAGDVSKSGTTVDNTLTRWDGADTSVIQGSGVTISDTNDVTGISDITIGGDCSLLQSTSDTIVKLIMTGDTTPPITNDTDFAQIEFFDNNDLSVKAQYAQIRAEVIDDDNTGVGGALHFLVTIAGTLTSFISLNHSGVPDVAINAPLTMLDSNKITNVLDPTAAQDVATKNYVDTRNLGDFAATTSAELASVISDETGSGLLVFGTSPTLVTPAIVSFTNAIHNHQDSAGGGQLLSTSALSDTDDIAYLNTANTYTAGTRQDFLGILAGTAGLNIGGIAGNPTTQVNGDIWLNTSTNQFFGRINGVNVDLGATGGGEVFTWTADHSTGGNSFILTDDASPPAGTVAAIYLEAGELNLNVATGNFHQLRINDVIEFSVQAGGIAINSVDKVFLDGVGATGDTFISEVAANTVNITVGGQQGIQARFISGSLVDVITGAQTLLATTAVAGFLHIARVDGVPTGTPSLNTGKNPMVIDGTNDALYIFTNSAWNKVGATSFVGFTADAVLDMAGFNIDFDSNSRITWNLDNNRSIQNDTTGFIYRVDTGDFHSFRINNSVFFEIGTNETKSRLNDRFVVEGSNASQVLSLFPDHSTPADAQVIGQIDFEDNSSTGVTRTYGQIRSVIQDPTNTTEDGEMFLSVIKGGTLTDYISINEANDDEIDFNNKDIRPGSGQVLFGAGGDTFFQEQAADDVILDVGGVQGFEWQELGTEVNSVVGKLSALALTATDGFLHMSSMVGVPTGTPTAYTGKIPLVYDTANNDLYAFNTAWQLIGGGALTVTTSEGIHTQLANTTEQDVVEILNNLNETEVTLDMTLLLQQTTVRFFEEVNDSAGYVEISSALYPDDFSADGTVFVFNGKNLNQKITFQSLVAEAGSISVPFARVNVVRTT